MLNEATTSVFGFEKLDVWRKSVDFASAIYVATRTFPRDEQYGMTSQLRRAVVSIAANIAEGASRGSGKDQARFFEIAFGSLNEVATMLHIAEGQGFIEREHFMEFRSVISDIAKMLSGLRRSALR